MKVYVASSWRNERQQEIVRALREAGHDVYDHPGLLARAAAEIDKMGITGRRV